MADLTDKLISQLIEINNPTSTDVIPVVNSGFTRKVTIDNIVGASLYSTKSISLLPEATEPEPENTLPIINLGSPRRIQVQNIYPVPITTSTIDLTLNLNNRYLTANVRNNSIQTIHIALSAVTTDTIADGAITEEKISPFAKVRGAVGGGSDRVFFENDQTINNFYTITFGKNAMTAGPVTIVDGIAVTVPTGSTWTIV